MRILLGLNSFRPGGAEHFVLHLAKAFSEREHEVSIFAMHDYGLNPEDSAYDTDNTERILGREFGKIKIAINYKPGKKYDKRLWQLNGIFRKFGIKDFRLKRIQKLQVAKLRKFIKENKIEIANTHLWEVDEFVSLHTDIPHVISMHGPYEHLLFQLGPGQIGGRKLDADFVKRAERVISKSGFIINSADKNLEVLDYIKCKDIVTQKIYLGYQGIAKVHERETAVDEFVFGMISRGLESKGWEIAIGAFLKLKENYKNCKLIFAYSHSAFMDDLKLKYYKEEGIEFRGYVKEQRELFETIDAFVYPTWDDCVPYVVIESLAFGVPVISTDVGEIPKMIKTNINAAGIIVPLDRQSCKAGVDNFSKAMETYCLKKDLFQLHRKNTALLFEQFSMGYCVSRYEAFYHKAISGFCESNLNK
jgi:glycosyltransferase involved in cell wall biosynthesis